MTHGIRSGRRIAIVAGLVASLAAIGLGAQAWAQPVKLKKVRISRHLGFDRLTLELDGPSAFQLEPPSSNAPLRFHLRLDAESGGRQLFSSGELVRYVRVDPRRAGCIVRVDLGNPDVDVRAEVADQPNRIHVEVHDRNHPSWTAEKRVAPSPLPREPAVAPSPSEPPVATPVLEPTPPQQLVPESARRALEAEESPPVPVRPSVPPPVVQEAPTPRPTSEPTRLAAPPAPEPSTARPPPVSSPPPEPPPTVSPLPPEPEPTPAPAPPSPPPPVVEAAPPPPPASEPTRLAALPAAEPPTALPRRPPPPLVARTPHADLPKTREELERLPIAEQRKLSFFDLLPIMDLNREVTLALIELVLLDLRYYLAVPVGSPTPDLELAVRRFQADLGHPATGVLLLGEFQELMRRMSLVHPSPVYPESFALRNGGEELVATGTWQNTAAPEIALDVLETSEIRCERSTSVCSEARAVLRHEAGRALLNVEAPHWKVTHWSTEEVIAERALDDCRREELRLALGDEAVERTQRNDCRAVSVRVWRLGDGARIGHEQFRQRWERAHQGYSSEFGGRFELPLGADAPR